MTNTFAPNNGKPASSEYGNGTMIDYFYDNLDRIVSLRYNGNEETSAFVSHGSFGTVTATKRNEV